MTLPISRFFSGAVVITALWHTPVCAHENRAYLQVNAGAVFAPTNSFITNDLFNIEKVSFRHDPGFSTGLALGYSVTEQFRLETELLYQANDFNNQFYATASSAFHGQLFKGERIRTGFLLNAYYDFKNSTNFTPYLTAGLGGYHAEFKFDKLDSVRNELDLAYQVGAGVNYKINERFSLDMKYRYFSGIEPHMKTVEPRFADLFAVGDHQIMTGIRISF